MRNVTTILLLATFLFSLSACKTQHVPYHSTASVPHYAMDVQTDMDLIRRESEEAMRERRRYAVFAAVDNNERPYLLLAPMQGTQYTVESAQLYHAAPVLPDRADEFISGLEETLRLWNGEGNGTFYEFMHAPEQEIRPKSENVVEWTSSVRFTFSQTADGPTARLRIGSHPTNPGLVRTVEMDDRQDVQDFKRLLEKARSQMQDMVTNR
jgi:hypothetical protein